MTKYSFDEFMEIIRKLRSKEGCPWDREQTHESLKACLLEECYETIEAIHNKDNDNLCEELGDILLQVALHSVIAEETKEFGIDDIINGVAQKMIRRHPHVFGDVIVENAEGVVRNWDDIKKKEKKANNVAEELLEIPKAFPAILRTEKVLKKVTKAGMEFGGYQESINRMSKRLKDLEKSMEIGDMSNFSEDFGDMLFEAVNLSRILQLNAENSLTNATNKFINRFVDVFALAESRGQNLFELSPIDQDILWREVD